MKWISVKNKLPRINQDVLVWVIYEGYKSGEPTDSFRQNMNGQYPSYYDQSSNSYWAMGSAKNYKVTHWMKIEKPNTVS